MLGNTMMCIFPRERNGSLLGTTTLAHLDAYTAWIHSFLANVRQRLISRDISNQRQASSTVNRGLIVTELTGRKSNTNLRSSFFFGGNLPRDIEMPRMKFGQFVDVARGFKAGMSRLFQLSTKTEYRKEVPVRLATACDGQVCQGYRCVAGFVPGCARSSTLCKTPEERDGLGSEG